VLMVVTATGMVIGDVPVLGVGVWSVALLALYLFALMVIQRLQKNQPWKPKDQVARKPQGKRAHPTSAQNKFDDSRPLGSVVVSTIVAGLAVLIAGAALAYTADRVASQTGLGASFVGFVLGGLVTSLPELSSTIEAVRLGQYEMAFSDGFGTNLCSLMLIFVTDLIYSGPPVLNEVGNFSLIAVLLGVAVTTIYLAGLIVRPKDAFLRMGFDSLLVLCTTVAGMLLLYRLK
jgi:cation:H+ antiporter